MGLLSGIGDSNSTLGIDVYFFECCVLSGKRFCNGPIRHTVTESYCVCVCVCVCVRARTCVCIYVIECEQV
jgi:hypothetical protein